MKYLKHDINTGFLFLIVFLLILFASFSVYFQLQLDEMSGNFNEQQEKLAVLSDKLYIEEVKSKKISNIKEAADENIEVLEEYYHSLANENEVLKFENTLMEEEIQSKPSIGACKAAGLAECPN